MYIDLGFLKVNYYLCVKNKVLLLKPYIVSILFSLLWVFTTSDIKAQTANDCEFAIPVCGDSNFGLEPDGVGFDEFSLPGNFAPPCYNFSNNTIWFSISVVQTGFLTFDIVPDNPAADYDFAVYGPTTDCKNLGQSIRCSSTNPQAAGVTALTGLNDAETDTSEGPGADGNGYLSRIDATAGETYYLLIDRALGDDGFSINMTGTAGFPEQPIANATTNLSSCDMDDAVDGFTQYDLGALISAIENGQTNVATSFHSSLNDANLNINALGEIYTNTSNPETIFYRVTNTLSDCSDINQLELNTTLGFIVTLPQDVLICTNTNDVAVLTTEAGYNFYQWSNGESGPDLYTITVTQGGMYSVIVTDNNGCNALAQTTVQTSQAPSIVEVTTTNFNQNNNTITVIATGDAALSYALDNSDFGVDNVFTEIPAGIYTIFVTDSLGCGIVSQEVVILDYPKYFTPNGDGIHDTWSIANIENFPNTVIRVYNRHGILIKDLNPTNREGWDGTNKYGRPLPSNDYWFSLLLESGRVVRGHFALKR